MRVRALALAACAAVLAAACGGRSTPTAPTTFNAQPPFTLANGSYVLSITMSISGVCTPAPGAPCSVLSACVVPSGASLVTVPAPIAVTVRRDGDTVTIQPDDPRATFAMSFQVTGTSVSGTASGMYTSGGLQVTVDDSSPGIAASVGGTLTSSNVSGRLTGGVTINGAGCSNNGHTWTLATR